MSDVIRKATQDDWADVADLIWEWDLEGGETPLVDQAAYRASFGRWMADSAGTHRCWVAERDGRVIGCAFLAGLSRSPRPSSGDRWVAEIQTVYVRAGERSGGVGGRLVRTLIDTAREGGAGRIIVHSRDRSQPVYHRAGFTVDALLMQQEL